MSSESKPNQFASDGLRRLVLRKEIATAEQISEAQGKFPNSKLISSLSQSGFINEVKLITELAKTLSLLCQPTLNDEHFAKAKQSEALNKIDLKFANTRRCLPLGIAEGKIQVAMADPLDIEAVQALEFMLEASISVVIAREHDILQLLKRLGGGSGMPQLKKPLPATNSGAYEVKIDDTSEVSERNVKSGSDSAPVVRLVNKILADALECNASDIHFEPGADGLELRFRIDGVMAHVLSIPQRLHPYVVTRIKLLARMDITERRRPQDGRFRISCGNVGRSDLRVSSVPTPNGEKLVLRLLRSDGAGVALEQLGFDPETFAKIIKALSARDRMLVVTGPTGSGKSTTLYSAINQVKEGSGNIITVEDPIEYRVAGVTQIQVDEKVGMTFATGLRSILRQDPDIIMVGEIRDLETAKVAFQAAQTGHLVLSTLHTNSAAAAIVRLIDLGLEPYVIAPSLGAIIAQRLVRRICKSCAGELSAEQSAEYRKLRIGTTNCRIGSGCDTCLGTGYRGRLGVYSLMEIDSELRELIRDGAGEEKIEQAARKSGMKTLLEAGLDIVEQGLTTLEELTRVVGAIPKGGLPQRGIVKQAELSSVQSKQPKGSAKSIENHSEKIVPVKPVEAPKVIETVEDLRNTFIFDQSANSTASAADDGQDMLTLEIPSDQMKAGSIADLATAAVYVASVSDIRQPKILLVDDDEGVRMVMGRALRRADFEVVEAEDGLDALEKLKEFSPDLVISDLVMPRLAGLDFVSRLRNQSATSKIPVLVLTGSDDEENEIKLINAGANDFVSKASSPSLVIARIKRLLVKASC